MRENTAAPAEVIEDAYTGAPAEDETFQAEDLDALEEGFRGWTEDEEDEWLAFEDECDEDDIAAAFRYRRSAGYHDDD